MKPGAMVIADREIVLNEGKETRELLVANVGDRPVQVGSHYHFFEVNRLLTFDREPAFGFRLDIPSGTSSGCLFHREHGCVFNGGGKDGTAGGAGRQEDCLWL